MNRLVVGTEVIVIRGNDKGKRGKVAKLLKDKDKVVVEGVNTVKRHLKATPQRGGGILQVEAAFPTSHVMPVDPESGKPTRVKAKVEGDKKQRVAKSGAVLAVAKES
jgi:large subunit ribosomal protein L24